MENVSLSNSINYENVKQLKYLYSNYLNYKRRGEYGDYTALDISLDLERGLRAMSTIQREIVFHCLMIKDKRQVEYSAKLNATREIYRAMELASYYLVNGIVLPSSYGTSLLENKKKRGNN